MKIIANSLLIVTVLSFILFAASCSKEGALIPTSESNNDVIPLEEAIELVIKHSQLLYPETRSNLNLSISDAITLTKKDLSKATRSEVSSEIPDTALYIFNFANNSGYAVTSANRKYGNTIFCITESGSLSVEDFGPIQTRASGDTTGMNDGTHFITDLITASIMSNEIAPPIDSTEVGGGPGADLTKYGPLLTTKWTQGNSYDVLPFNQYTPNNVAAGCAAIATAQIMVCNKYSNTMVFDGHTCNWDTLASVKPYNNITSLGSNEAQEQVGRFVYELGKTNNIHIRYNNGCWAQADGVKRTFENYGYQNVNKYTGFGSTNIARVDASIKSGLPVFSSGNHEFEFEDFIGSFYGHAWVIDGLFWFYYHINWGWGGDSDGYFNKGVFKTTSRQFTDSIIDANVPTASQDEEYLWWFRIITYSL